MVTLALTFFNSRQIEAQLGHENPKLLPSPQGGPIAHWPAPGKAGDGGEAREARAGSLHFDDPAGAGTRAQEADETAAGEAAAPKASAAAQKVHRGGL